MNQASMTQPICDSDAVDKKMTAPVALFIFRRPQHLRLTIASLLKCKGIQDTPIIVFGDGPRHDAERGEVENNRAQYFLFFVFKNYPNTKLSISLVFPKITAIESRDLPVIKSNSASES